MLRSEKHEFVEHLQEVYKQSSSVIITHYHGLSVSQITALRKSLRDNGAGFKVVKNTLTKIAAGNAGVKDVSNLLKGPTAIAYSADPVIAAKKVVEFAKSNNKLTVVGGIVDNEVLSAEQVLELSKLPSLDELRGKIIGVLQAPASKIVGILQAAPAQLARVIQAHADKN